jgi:hypothetical protein
MSARAQPVEVVTYHERAGVVEVNANLVPPAAAGADGAMIRERRERRGEDWRRHAQSPPAYGHANFWMRLLP